MTIVVIDSGKLLNLASTRVSPSLLLLMVISGIYVLSKESSCIETPVGKPQGILLKRQQILSLNVTVRRFSQLANALLSILVMEFGIETELIGESIKAHSPTPITGASEYDEGILTSRQTKLSMPVRM